METGLEVLVRAVGGVRRVVGLEAENDQLKVALGEAHVRARVQKLGAEYLPVSRILR